MAPSNVHHIEFRSYPPTTYDDWARSDAYHNDRLIRNNEALNAALQTSQELGLRAINVSAAQGKFLHLQAKVIGAKRVLEIGTLGGYSAIWMGRALPLDGELITLELAPHIAELARKNITSAGLENIIKVITGPAIESLPNIGPDGSFDMIFIDADKASVKDYFIHAKRLVRTGGIIIVDNVVRNGKVDSPGYEDGEVFGIRNLLDYIKEDNGLEVDATTIATVGEKGYDGFLYAIKMV